MNKRHALLFGEIKSAVDSDMDSDDVIRFVCQMLFDGVPHFDWVGVYRCVPEREALVLGPYSGEETEHEEIPYGSGVCGRVARSGQKLVVADVSTEGNYIACSLQVRSEAVVPVKRAGQTIAVLDVDSFTPDGFSREDVELLEGVAEEIVPFI